MLRTELLKEKKTRFWISGLQLSELENQRFIADFV
jgi:hypothetical protein